jgi:hypothetical protein
MKLSEALKASRTGKATALLDEDGERTILQAEDGGVTFVRNDKQGYDYAKCSWADLLPEARRLIAAADWAPVEPKNALIQLAEVLTDWTEDDPEP